MNAANIEALLPVLQQHVEEVAFLWLMRDKAVSGPHYDLSAFSDLDSRVNAHIDGISVARESGTALCADALGDEGPGEVFSAVVIALRGGHGTLLEKAVDVAQQSEKNRRALISAAGWSGTESFRSFGPSLLQASSTLYQYMGVGGYAVHRVDLGEQLNRFLDSTNTELRARALKAVGELKRQDLLPDLRHWDADDDPAVRFWSVWSAALLGDRNVGETLKSFVNFDTEFAHRAIQLAPRILESGNCQDWLRGLAQDESSRRYALIGCGVTGDPVYIPTLISQMAVPEHARVAGEAFSMITGVDLAYEDLDTDQPEGFEAGPTEDPADENVDLDPDEDLPWPNPELIERWWHEHSRDYQNGVRYLCGRAISDENCRRVLREGYQRQRISAAYELALMNPDEPLFEWRAPGFRQQEWLGLRKPSRRYRR